MTSLAGEAYTFIYLAGGGIGLILFLVAVAGGLWREPELVTPRAYRGRRLKAHPPAAGQLKPDRAWPLYPLRQAAVDKGAVRDRLAAAYRPLWEWPTNTLFLGKHGPRFLWWLLVLVVYPVVSMVLTALVGCALTGWLCYLVYWLVVTACSAVYLVAHGVLAVFLLTADEAHRAVKRTAASCPECFLVTPWPAYECPGCGEIHHDIRPGRLGLFTRRCRCGARLPTLPARAGRTLAAVCQRCGKPLASGAGAVRDVRIAIFGEKSAGKTRFLYAALNSLTGSAGRPGIEAGFADPRSKDKAEAGLSLIRSGQHTPATPVPEPPVLTMRLGGGLVSLFDVAGQRYRDPGQHAELAFMEGAQGLVHVLDPFSVSGVRGWLAGHPASGAHPAREAGDDQETTYAEVTTRLRDNGVPASAQYLAVVVAKADLLREAGLRLPSASDALAAWLGSNGAHNIVQAARRDFAEVRFFAVASQDLAGASADYDPGTPLRWLLTAHGVRLGSVSPGSQDRPSTVEARS